MPRAITFNKTGYDPFIDFIKAYAIICVLIGHTLPMHDYWGYGLWAGMQVPLFVLVQSFHCFKKEQPKFSFRNIVRRILIPYFLIQVFIFIFYALTKNRDFITLTKSFILNGGMGPGSYYPWVYIQIAILLPVVKKLMDKTTKVQIAVVSLIICELFEIISSVIDLPEHLHRLLAIRYFFLFYFAWIWVKEGIVLNKRLVILSLLSFLSIIYFEYFSVDDEIWFYNTGWKFHRWPCYYYVSTGGYICLICCIWFYKNTLWLKVV